MTPLPILDLIAGLIFIYFLLAIVNNSLFELVTATFNLRATYLRTWLETTFPNKVKERSLAHAIMDHPLLSGLSKSGKSTTYINAKSFAPALIEIIFTHAHPPGTPFTMENIRKAIADTTVLPTALKDVFLFFVDKTNAAKAASAAINELEHFESQVATWFNHIMERVGSRFKRHSLIFAFIFGTILTVPMNIDSISLANYLYSNPTAREQFADEAFRSLSDSAMIRSVEQIRKQNAHAAVPDSAKEKANQNIDNFIAQVSQEKKTINGAINTLNANLPIGWNANECKIFCKHPVKKIGGWLITVMAICLGAPFWFEVLGKIANIRSSIKPDNNGTKEPAKK